MKKASVAQTGAFFIAAPKHAVRSNAAAFNACISRTFESPVSVIFDRLARSAHQAPPYGIREQPIDTPDNEAPTRIISAHVDAGDRHGARFRKKGWRASPRLSTMLDRLECLAGREQKVSVGKMLNAIGRSSFAPLLLVPGLIVLSPVGSMPGVPTTVAILVGIAALQILRGRCYFWLPDWLLNRHVKSMFLSRAIRFMRPLARVSEAWCRPRMRWMTGDIGSRAIAALCLGICVAMPPLEIVPMANSACGAALALFGLALTTRDGLLTGLALVLCVTAATTIAMSVF